MNEVKTPTLTTIVLMSIGDDNCSSLRLHGELCKLMADNLKYMANFKE